MFKLQKQNRSSKSAERVDFKFSSFQAIQIPKGWDRLFLFMISVETGKTVGKLGKATVRNGNCLWTETLLESVWISKDDSTKEFEECLFKFVISMGSSRAGILGEAIINMASYYKSSKMSSPVSLPLRKCNHGTILQVKIHCLTPRHSLRQENLNSSSSPAKDQAVDYQDMDHKPNTSDDSFANGVKVSSGQDLAFTSNQGKYESQESCHSESSSNHMSNSVEDHKKGYHPNSSDDLSSNGCISQRRYVGASPRSSLSHDEYPPDDRSLSSQSSCNSGLVNSRLDLQSSGKESGSGSPRNPGSTNLLEAAEGTIDELRAEAKMWERNARKLMLDLDMLRNESLDQSKKHADLVMELSAAYAEQDGLKKEFERLKLLLEESTEKQRSVDSSAFQSEGPSPIEKELESEIKYQQESNANLALQLKRSQESNIELVSVLQELEETIEQQKAEIENLSQLQLKYADMERSVQKNLEDNRYLSLQLQQLQESEKRLQMDIQLLEKALEDKSNELEKERSLNSQSLLDIEREYKQKLLVKDDEIAHLEAKVLKSLENNENNVDLIREIESLKEKMQELETDCNELTDENLELLLKLKDLKKDSNKNVGSFSSVSGEFQRGAPSEVNDVEHQIYGTKLKKKVKEDHWTVNETSELFLELLKQVEVAFHHLMKPVFSNSSVVSEKCQHLHDDLVNLTKTDMANSKGWAESIVKYFLELNKLLDDRITEFEEVLKHGKLEIQNKNAVIADSEKCLKDHALKIQEQEIAKAEQEAAYANLLPELSRKRSEIEKLEAHLLLKEVENNSLIQHQTELEVQIAHLEMRKSQLEQQNETVRKESTINSKCMDDLRNGLAVLSSRLDSHVSAKKDLEMKASELETEKLRLESKNVELEQENLLLQDHISVLNIQVTQFKEETEFYQSELKNSQAIATDLQAQITSLEKEMETQKFNLKQEFHDTQDQLLEAQSNCECLRTENQELHASVLRLGEERKMLQKLNKELKKKELELHERCAQLEAQFEESERNFSDCSKKIEALENNLASVLETLSLKEKNLNSELDALLQENRIEKEKLSKQETLWNQMYLEMSAELKSLQEKVEHLTRQIFVACEEKKKAESEASSEIASLLADKTKLESTLQELYLKVESSESELNSLREESDLEVQKLMTELAASEQSMELVRAEHNKLLKQLASYRRTEEKLKTTLNDLELKLTVSDYENQQLREENAHKKIQYQRISELQDEVSVCKRKMEESRLEKEKLEASLQTVSGEYETLKAEKISCSERILSLQEEISEYENCKQKRMALEEMLHQMQEALLAKEAHRIDLENELSEVKKANEQYQQKIHHIEEVNAEYTEKAQALEADLKLMKEKCNCGRKNGTSSKARLTKASKHKELADALDVDNVDKIELQSFSSEEQSNQRINLKKSISDNPVVPKERYERTKSSLEAELRDLRERYFHMSLRYAEVEAQREDLVMKLKAVKTGKRWFS